MASCRSPSIQLIINADDFGHCEGRNRGIVECYQEGLVSSASLMVNGREAIAAARLADRSGIPLGLHLNLTEGPLTNRGRCGSLVDDNSGVLRGKFGFRKALASGMLNKDELREEIEAQFCLFKELTGHPPSHVDGHQHVHVLPGVCDVLVDVARDFAVDAVRIPIQEGLAECSWLSPTCQQFFSDVARESAAARDVFMLNGLRAPHGFLGLSTMGLSMTPHTLESALDAAIHSAARTHHADPVTLELMVHPGHPCPPGCGVEGEDFFCLEDRAHEMGVLGGSAWKEVIRRAGVKLCSFKDLEQRLPHLSVSK